MPGRAGAVLRSLRHYRRKFSSPMIYPIMAMAFISLPKPILPPFPSYHSSEILRIAANHSS